MPEELALVDEVPQVGAAETRAGGAVARLVQGSVVSGVPGVAEIDAPGPGHRTAGARGTRRQYAVEHVHAGLDHLEDALDVADTHEVARLVLRHHRRSLVGGGEHRLPVLADREPADRVAVEVELRDLLGRAAAELWVGAALGDAESQLAVGARRVALPSRPLGRAPNRVFELAPRDAGG